MFRSTAVLLLVGVLCGDAPTLFASWLGHTDSKAPIKLTKLILMLLYAARVAMIPCYPPVKQHEDEEE